MIKTITSLITPWLANSIYKIASWLESKNASVNIQSRFVDLAPKDDVDEDETYSDAILYATNNPKVSNIALTGPYGSGKSSIIQTFLKKHPQSALHISLAAFLPGSDSVPAKEGDSEHAKERDSKNTRGDVCSPVKVSRQEIERSILQQMLYGADSKKLPLSRFKRIQSPSGVWRFFKSLYIMFGIFALWYVLDQRDDIISGAFFDLNMDSIKNNWPKLGVFSFGVVFLWSTLHHFYVASFGLSLKSISLKDIEIKPANDDQASILNRHLDEIIYFFQSTNYDLVIIEDLDRFKNPDIFVTLREINSLVNKNAGVKPTIRFLYALGDDMFANTDRTKFFEFIIPVIPIINSSNSIDMVLKEGKRLELDVRFDRQFLREVSRYLNDLRLIRNIFNEYAIYLAKLEPDEENFTYRNKLLAIVVYKNVYPKDFEDLHCGVGILADILNLQDKLISDGESKYKTKIVDLEKRLDVAERQIPSDLKELRQIYAMALIEKLPVNTATVDPGNRKWSNLHQLVKHDDFEQLITSSNILCRNINDKQLQRFDASKLQSEVNSQKTYPQRKEEIENKAAENKNESLRQIRELKSKIAELRTTKLNELLRLNADRVQDLFEKFKENGELARFLILEGYLDDTYYHYTSLFHSGRLSPHDNKFLIKIRAFITPEPDFPIDNPKEVIAEMREEDFRQSYVLNVKLVDSLLSNPGVYSEQIKKLVEFLSSEFENCENFFDSYYASGSHVAGLLSGLARSWEGFIPSAIASTNNISHVNQLIANLSETILKRLARDFSELPEFVSVNLPEIIINSPEIEPKRIVCLGFELEDFAVIKEHPKIVRALFENGLFKITIQNLEYVYQSLLDENNLELMRDRNFTTIRSVNNALLMKRIERDFERYFNEVLLKLEGNCKEDVPAILDVIRHDTLDEGNLKEFLRQQTVLLPTLEGVPERLHAILFELSMIEPIWINCLTFMQSDGFEAGSLVSYLDKHHVRTAILKDPIPSSSDSLELRQFLFEAGSLSDTAYKEYAHALPKAFDYLPKELEPTKLRILIDEEKITFTKENLDELSNDRDLQIIFIVANIDEYLEEPEKFNLDDDFLEDLLRSEINDAEKLRIVELMDLESLVGLPERSALIGQIIIQNTDTKTLELNSDIVKSLVQHSDPVETKISLLNKYCTLLNDDEIRQTLAGLPRPFSEIKTGYNKPRLENTRENQELVKWLKSKEIISSYDEKSFSTDYIKVYLFRA
jgi:predicted DNA-binding antitoxin AbrB/MazE fold protein